MSDNTPIFFYICLFVGSIWGPISVVSWILYPERVQKRILEYSRKGIAKYNSSLPQIRKKKYLKELRLAGFVFIPFFALFVVVFLFLAKGWFYKLIAGLQIASFLGAFLFAKFFPDKFWGKYK
ncbi:MAG: hypothetical protein KAT71_01680 [Gammaproteobacteria bacterium]|nr:hypothetical protein [Gammaproteobacteria bacterium]